MRKVQHVGLAQGKKAAHPFVIRREYAIQFHQADIRFSKLCPISPCFLKVFYHIIFEKRCTSGFSAGTLFLVTEHLLFLEEPPMHNQINPQARALLRQWAEDAVNRPQPAHPLTIPEQIAASRIGFHRLDPLAGEPEPVWRIVQRTLPGPGGPLPVRIYQPCDTTGLPVLVYLHGGGCTIGDLDTIDRPLRQLSNCSGWLIVSVDYRLAPEHPFPAAWEDAYTVAQWVATHASEINADARLLAIGGDSAGGLLATATTLIARDRNGPGIALQILINPSTSGYADFDTRSWQDYDGVVLNQAEVKRDLDLTYGDQDRSHPWISPLKARNLAHLPPALILTAGCDPLRDEGEAYADRLKQAGVRVTLTRYAGMIHGFFGFAGILDDGKTAIDQVAQALQQLAEQRHQNCCHHTQPIQDSRMYHRSVWR